MDFQDRSIDELKGIASARYLAYDNDINKDDLIKILEFDDGFKASVSIQQTRPNGKAGSIITIVLSSLSLALFTFYLCIFFIAISFASGSSTNDSSLGTIFIIIFGMLWLGSLVSIITNVRYIKGKNNKVSAGIWGILFGGLIGGILTLCNI